MCRPGGRFPVGGMFGIQGLFSETELLLYGMGQTGD